jgi:hypothetical protein
MQMRKRALTAALLFLAASIYLVLQERFDARFDNAPLTVDTIKAGNCANVTASDAETFDRARRTIKSPAASMKPGFYQSRRCHTAQRQSPINIWREPEPERPS